MAGSIGLKLGFMRQDNQNPQTQNPKAPKASKAPQPLTQCPPPDLDWSRGITPIAANFDDIYFSVDGGIEETKAVFLAGCGLPQAWHSQSIYTIGELGFGTGLNFLTTWQVWEDEMAAPQKSHLHFISIEKYPLDKQQLCKALEAWPQLAPFAARLIQAWPGRVKGFHRLEFGNITLTLIHDDVSRALNSLNAKIDAWFLDGFSPAKNPDMWDEVLMHKIAQLSADKARLASFTVAGPIRRALQQAGFTVEKKPGFGRKRHRLEARLGSETGQAPHKTQKPPSLYPAQKYRQTPIIIGRGIGGAALARAFKRRGIKPKILHYRHEARAASHNAAALVKPRLDLQDRPESRFFLAAYLYALKAYQHSSGILAQGVTQIAKNEKEAERFEKLTRHAALGAEHISFSDNILTLPMALMVQPQALIQDWMDGLDVIEQKVTNFEPFDGPIFAAPGYGVRSFLDSDSSNPDSTLLRFSRGQISWADSIMALKSPVSYGGYALPLEQGLMLGATHDRVTRDDPYQSNPDDDRRNFEAFTDITGHMPKAKPERPSRASIRVTTAKTLPMIICNPQQAPIKAPHYILTGLGSRGFTFAPLLAEAIICDYLGEAMPIEKDLWHKLRHFLDPMH